MSLSESAHGHLESILPGIGSRCHVIARIARDEADTLELPHVVHLDDPFLDVPLVFGPFEGAVLAMAFAESYVADVIYVGCDVPPTATIVPLRSVYPA